MKSGRSFMKIVNLYNSSSLILRILAGLIIGIILAMIVPHATWISVFGDLFVGALKAIAPVLVFVLVLSALAQGNAQLDRRFGLVIWLYMLTTFLAGLTAVIFSFLFPVKIVLTESATAETIPQGIGEVMRNLLMNAVSNPVSALANANYIGILFWAVFLGLAMKKLCSDSTSFRCSITVCPLDYKSCTVWNHGTCFHKCLHKRSCDFYAVWATLAASSWNHAICRFHHRSVCDFSYAS